MTYYRRIDQSEFARKERNLHCDVHVGAENKHILPSFGTLYVLVLDHAIAAILTSR